jgi:hypothetical protein
MGGDGLGHEVPLVLQCFGKFVKFKGHFPDGFVHWFVRGFLQCLNAVEFVAGFIRDGMVSAEGFLNKP